MTNYTQAGQYLTTRHVTDKKIVRNPWLAEVQEGQEIYTLPFSATGVDVRLLLPGTHMRVRVVAQFDKGLEEGQNANLEQQEQTGESENGVNTIQADTYENTNSSVSPKAAIVFDDLVTVDMLNSQNESIFEIYMALLKMPVEQRIQYMETKIEESTASAFQSRVIPASLVFALTKEQATAMAEFENLNGAAIKYTILPEKDPLVYGYPVQKLKGAVQRETTQILFEFPDFFDVVYSQYSVKNTNILLVDVVESYWYLKNSTTNKTARHCLK